MKLYAKIGETMRTVEIEQDGAKTFAIVDGERMEFEVSAPEPNVHLIKKDGKIFEVFAALNPDSRAPKLVSVDGKEIEVRIFDPKRLGSAASLGERIEGLAEIRAAMPGKVVRSLLKIGDTVGKGDGVMVVEAMKMQNELKSPKAGVLKELRVSEGDTVAAGDVLAIIE